LIDDRGVTRGGGSDRIIGEDHHVVDRDGAGSAAEAEQVEVEGGEGAGSDASQGYLDSARGVEGDRPVALLDLRLIGIWVAVWK
jgi:hypothetical protein